MNSLDLIEAAKALVHSPKGKPKEVFLRRAISTAYYALFHCLARECADLMIGGTGARRSKPAWVQAYRALEHGHAKSQCENQDVIRLFSKGIADFAYQFRTLQQKRHSADYDPFAKFFKSSVQNDIQLAEQAISSFKLEKPSDRRAFCAWVLFRVPKKEAAPKKGVSRPSK